MADPREGLTSDGFIRTGAARERLVTEFAPVVDAAIAAVQAASPEASLYVYGSTVTGQAATPTSDVDLLTMGVPTVLARQIADSLTVEFAPICRSVDIAAAQPDAFVGEHDEAYGNRVFLRHYCVHLCGSDPSPTNSFAGDARAARGFNGDIAQHAVRWRDALGAEDSAVLGRRIARKLLLAVAGLVSVHDTTWTTDREKAVDRWSELHPDLATHLTRLHSWIAPSSAADTVEVADALVSVLEPVVGQFASTIGLWPPSRN